MIDALAVLNFGEDGRATVSVKCFVLYWKLIGGGKGVRWEGEGKDEKGEIGKKTRVRSGIGDRVRTSCVEHLSP